MVLFVILWDSTDNLSNITLWNQTLLALEMNRVDLTSVDKGNGRILTDYLEGPIESMGFAGALGTISTRYKYNIIINPLTETKTRLNITCSLESRSVLSHSLTPQ